MALIDNRIYVAGSPAAAPNNLDETYELLRQREGMAWIGLYRPDNMEVHSIAEEFSLHPLAVEGALKGHQRAKLDRYGDTLFVVLRPAWYLDIEEAVEFGEVHLFIGPTVRCDGQARRQAGLSQGTGAGGDNPDCWRAVLRQSCTQCSMRWSTDTVPSSPGLENDIDEIEDQLFGGDPAVSRRIYQLLGEVIDFQRAAGPLRGMLEALLRGSDKYQVDVELQNSLRDVLDHVLRTVERADVFRFLLQNALTVHSTLVTQGTE